MRLFKIVVCVILINLALLTQETEAGKKTCPPCGPNQVCNQKTGKCKCDGGFMWVEAIQECRPSCWCHAKGDPHYLGFDNDDFDYQGSCKYILAERNSDNKPECNFKVVVKNEDPGDREDVTITKYLQVYLPGNTNLQVGPGDTLLWNGVKTSIGFEENGHKLIYRDRYVVLTTKCGVDIAYNGVNRAYVHMLKEDFAGSTTGLCGNCNGNKVDDCVKPNGESMIKDSKCQYRLWGDSWVHPDPDEECVKTDEEDVTVKSCEQETIDRALDLSRCGLLDITQNGLWTQYFQENTKLKERAAAALEDCEMDFCEADEAGDEKSDDLACQALQSFMDEAEELGVYLPDYKEEDGRCAPKCDSEPHMRFYKDKPCAVGCSGQVDEDCVDFEGQSGCGCEDGYILSGGKCIKPEECGCKRKKVYYELGEKVVTKDCKEELECMDVKGDKIFVPTSRSASMKDGCLKDLAKCVPNKKTGIYECRCNKKKGLVGDGRESCLAGCGKNNVQCSKNAQCKEGKCECNKGFSGNGEYCEDLCTCKNTGNHHVKTFDSSRFHFQGNCSYILARSFGLPKCRFLVETQHEYSTEDNTVSLISQVTVYIGRTEIKIQKNRKAFVNGKKVFGEDSGQGYSIYRNGKFIEVKSKCGMRAGFDGKKVFVQVPREHGENMQGLCGDCDRNKKNDLRTLDGEKIDKKDPGALELWGSSYQIDDGQYCITNKDVTDPCTGDAMKKAKKACKALTNTNGPLKNYYKEGKDETDLIDEVKEIYEDCLLDYCELEGKSEVQEDTICDYMEAAVNIFNTRVPPQSWRTKKICDPEKYLGCSEEKNTVYSKFVSSCDERTCEDPKGKKKGKNCKEIGKEGCACKKKNMYKDGDRCVKRKECGCSYKKHYYKIGETIAQKGCRNKVCVHKGGRSKFVNAKGPKCKKDEKCVLEEGENKCVCKEGFERMKNGKCRKSCGGKQCSKNSRCTSKKKCKCKNNFYGNPYKKCESRGERCKCSAKGDPHFRTFDGQKLDHMGICKYLLSKFDDPKKKCSYKAMVQNERRTKPKPSYVRYYEIEHSGRVVRLGQGRSASVDGNPVALPFRYKETGKGGFVIYLSGSWVVMESTKCDQTFRFDGNNKAELNTYKPKSKKDLTGICGNCDNNRKNDFVRPDGSKVDNKNKKKRVNELFQSWLVPDPNGPTPEQCKKEDEKPDIKCSGKTKKLIRDTEWCGAITDPNGVFATCLKDKALKEEAKQIYDNCYFDVCANEGNDPEMEREMCDSVADIAEACAKAGFIVKWRSNTFCSKECGENMRFEPESDCPETCMGKIDCLESGDEGCVCEDGYIMSNRKCVQRSECGCTADLDLPTGKTEEYVELGATFIRPDNCGQSLCQKIGNSSVLKEVVGKNVCDPDKATCQRITVDGKTVGECKCKDGFAGDGYSCYPFLPGPLPETPTEPATGTTVEGSNPSVPTAPGLVPVPPPPPPAMTTEDQTGGPPAPPGEVPGGNPPGPPAGPPPGPGNPPPPGPPMGPPPGPAPGETIPGMPPVPEKLSTPAVPETVVILTESPTEAPTSTEAPTEIPVITEILVEAPTETPTEAPAEVPTDTEPPTESPAGTEAPESPAGTDAATESQAGTEAPTKPTSKIIPAGPEEPCEEEEDPSLPKLKPGEKPDECIHRDDSKGENYIGSLSVTVSGIECQSWRNHTPHHSAWHEKLADQGNKCRNLRLHADSVAKEGPWCLTTDPDIKWMYCKRPPFCEEVSDTKEPPNWRPLNETEKGCFNVSDKGESYTGEVYYTKEGLECERWTDHNYMELADAGNRCRNPEKEMEMPFCFVGKNKKRLCDIKECNSKPKNDPVKNKCEVDLEIDICKTTTKMTGDCEQTFKMPDDCKFTVKREDEDLYQVYFPTDGKNGPLKVGETAHSPKCNAVVRVTGKSKVEITWHSCGGCLKAAVSAMLPPTNDPESLISDGFCNL